LVYREIKANELSNKEKIMMAEEKLYITVEFSQFDRVQRIAQDIMFPKVTYVEDDMQMLRAVIRELRSKGTLIDRVMNEISTASEVMRKEGIN